MIGEAVPVLVGIAPALVASVAVGGIIGVSLNGNPGRYPQSPLINALVARIHKPMKRKNRVREERG